MDLPINNEELKELMDALNESNHPDAMKRQFRNELHRKLRLTKFLIEEKGATSMNRCSLFINRIDTFILLDITHSSWK